MAKVKPWQVSASFWNKVKPVIPSPKLDPNKKYRGQPGGGRKPCQRNVLAVRVLSFAGRKVVFWLLFGQLDWLKMMKWRLSAGNGQAPTETL